MTSRKFFLSQFKSEAQFYEFRYYCHVSDTMDLKHAEYWINMAMRHGSVREMVKCNINLAVENGHDHAARVY